MIELATLMNPWIVVAVSLVLLSALLLAYLAYSGLFTQVEISARELVYGELTICYKIGRGPYKNTGNQSWMSNMIEPNKHITIAMKQIVFVTLNFCSIYIKDLFLQQILLSYYPPNLLIESKTALKLS